MTEFKIPWKYQRFHQLSDMEFLRAKKVLKRIKKAYDYLEANKHNKKATDMAIKLFEESVLPECRAVGFEDHFSRALLFFGKDFLDKEFAGRQGLKEEHLKKD